MQCPYMSTFTVDAENTVFKSIDGVIFNKAGDTLIKFPPGKEGSYTTPAGVTTIGKFAIYNCGQVTEVILSEGVKTIEDAAFNSSFNLTKVTIPASVETIGSEVFSGCKSLTEINVAAENTKYSSSDGTLLNKSGNTIIAVPGGKSGTYAIPTGVTTIDDSAFLNCGEITGITIPARECDTIGLNQ